MMREKRWFPVIYMFLVTAFFSTIVIGFTQFTLERVYANQRLAFETAVYMVMPTIDPPMNSQDVHVTFSVLNKPDESSGGAYYLKKTKGEIKAYALPFEGQGFWAPIKGVIGIEGDKKTITGIYFYEQNETPGLGAEIAKEAFRGQFIGKTLAEKDKALNIKRPGDELGPSDVHAVTGATQTSIRLEKIINTAIEEWLKQLEE
jgi:Na+-transporting NADH:ubiquinone oxidoreductase subunit C